MTTKQGTEGPLALFRVNSIFLSCNKLDLFFDLAILSHIKQMNF
jgi:hypothetical protein